MDSRPPGISPGRLLLIYGVALVTLFVVVPSALYFIIDPERLDLDDRARAGVRTAEFVMGVAVAQPHELTRRRFPGSIVKLETFGIDGEVKRRGSENEQRHERDAVDEQ